MLTPKDVATDPARQGLLARRAALLLAANKSDKEICAELGISKGTLDVLKKSPLFLESVHNYADTVEKEGLQAIIDDLHADWPKNRDFIKNVRDGVFGDDTKKMDLRLRAAKMLLDKQAPNAGDRANNENAARIILDGKLLGQVLRSLRNVGVIDITPETIDSATADTITEVVEPLTPDEFAESYTPPDPEDRF